MPKKEHRFVYRDRETGYFVAKDTWERSKAHGGSRYVRMIVEDKVATMSDLMDEIMDDDQDYEDVEFGGGIGYGDEE